MTEDEYWSTAWRKKKTAEAIVQLKEQLAIKRRNDVLEEVAREFEKMPFGDTAASFAVFVRNMKT